ncbi:hypothetical protein HZH68_004499 [Vespula germanica]|uniref:Uncharacterized protein n=1 Tax=Vespula germanica TaxID=30212 RepID=A0A834NJU2_VESGE|nr:hypothetical protein HZH68_004499 [Vespula germanica]
MKEHFGCLRTLRSTTPRVLESVRVLCSSYGSSSGSCASSSDGGVAATAAAAAAAAAVGVGGSFVKHILEIASACATCGVGIVKNYLISSPILFPARFVFIQDDHNSEQNL